YEDAARCYEKEKRFLEAAALYEHLIFLRPDTTTIVMRLIHAHAQLHHISRAYHYATQMITLLVQKKRWSDLLDFLSNITTLTHLIDISDLCETIVFALVNGDEIADDDIMSAIACVIDLFSIGDTPLLLQKFLSKLRMTNEEW